MANAWRIELLGKLQVVQEGRTITDFETRKTGALLGVLALSLPHACSRELLLERLWPDEDPQATRLRLRQALSALRRVFEPADAGTSDSPCLLADRLQVRLDSQAVITDVAEFEAAVLSAARANSAPERLVHLQHAASLYQGELLPGYYEDFFLSIRGRLAEAYRDVLVGLSTALSRAGDHAAAIKAAKQAVSTDILDEECHVALMRAYAAAGRPSDALRQARELERVLRREFDAEPSEATRALVESFRAAGTRFEAPPVPVAVLEATPPASNQDKALPGGTVTFFLTDVEESTKLWEQHPEAMRQALLRHESLASRLIEQHGGRLIKARGEGDSLFAVFPLAKDAVTCACTVQRAFQEEPWPSQTPLRLRIALHTGEAQPGETDYTGSTVNRCARLRSLAQGGETLLSQSTEQLVHDSLPEGTRLQDLGDHRLRGLSRPERVFRLVPSGAVPRWRPWFTGRGRTAATVLLAAVLCSMLLLALRIIPARQPGGPADPARDDRTVAVLPFDVISSAGTKDAYFADGLTEELTNSLGNIQGLTVIGRISAARIKDTLTTGRSAIAQQLHVGTLIRGEVSKEPGKLRVYVEADDAQGQKRIWHEQYDKSYRVDNVLEIEGDVAQSVARALRIRLTTGEKDQIARRYTDNDAAYDFYLQGRYFWNQRTEQSLRRAIAAFDKAIALDPHYAPAYVGKSDAYDVLGYYGYLDSAEAYRKAWDAAHRALTEAIGDDGTLAAAYASRAFAEMVYRQEWASADADLSKARQLGPDYATAHQWYSLYLMLQNRVPESIQEINEALKKDPLSFIIGTSLGGRYYYAGQYDRAIQQYNQVLDLSPDYTVAYFWRGLALEKKKQYAAAASDFAAAVQRSHRSPLFLAFLGKDYAMSGQRGRALAIRAELQGRAQRHTVSAFSLAVIAAGLGERDEALTLMERSYEAHDGSLVFLQEAAPAFAGLRSDPRFQGLRKKMGLPSSYGDIP